MNFQRSVITAKLWRPEIARTGNFKSDFCVFFGKTTLYGIIFIILFQNIYMTTPIDVLVVVFECRKICTTGNRWNRALFTVQNKNKNLASSQTVAAARASLWHLAHNVPDFIQIGALSAELYPNAWRSFFCPIEYFHDRLFEPITRWLYCVECPQCSIRLEQVQYLCTSYLLPAFDM